MQGALVFRATIVLPPLSDGCRAGKWTPIGGDGAHQAQGTRYRIRWTRVDAVLKAVSNQKAGNSSDRNRPGGDSRHRQGGGRTVGDSQSACRIDASDDGQGSLTSDSSESVSRLLRRHLILHQSPVRPIHYSAYPTKPPAFHLPVLLLLPFTIYVQLLPLRNTTTSIHRHHFHSARCLRTRLLISAISLDRTRHPRHRLTTLRNHHNHAFQQHLQRLLSRLFR